METQCKEHLFGSVYFGLLKAWDISNKYFGGGQQIVCQTMSYFSVFIQHNDPVAGTGKPLDGVLMS